MIKTIIVACMVAMLFIIPALAIREAINSDKD